MDSARTSALAVIVMAVIWPALTSAQSFNCRYAKTPDEVVICENPALSLLDTQMASWYSASRSGPARGQVETEQRAWLQYRRSCGSDLTCLKQAYEDRIDALQERGTDAQCSGILHNWRAEGQDGIGFGGATGEGEGICVIAKSEETKVLARCSFNHFCKVKGLQKSCKDSGECGELTVVYSVTSDAVSDHREAAATDVPAKSVSEMKCPKGWAYFNNMYRQTGAEPYMHCDFTTLTCERGFITHLRDITSRVFELLAKDRQTVIGHYMCPGSGGCMDFDSGLFGEGRSTFAHPIFCDPKT